MQLTNTFNKYRVMMAEKLCRRQVPPTEKKALIEVILVLIVGILYGLHNPHQVAQELGLRPKPFYRSLRSLSAASWRRLLERLMTQAALERLQQVQERSPATPSRQRASLSINDTVQKRLGKALSYLWAWYSGQAQRVLRGQDLVGIVLRLGPEILPLRLIWVSKQGRGPASKPAVVLQALRELKEEFAAHGVDLTRLGLKLRLVVAQPGLQPGAGGAGLRQAGDLRQGTPGTGDRASSASVERASQGPGAGAQLGARGDPRKAGAGA